jgi:hypothetical protein
MNTTSSQCKSAIAQGTTDGEPSMGEVKPSVERRYLDLRSQPVKEDQWLLSLGARSDSVTVVRRKLSHSSTENNLEINPKETNTSEETDESIQDYEILQNRHATELGSPEDR